MGGPKTLLGFDYGYRRIGVAVGQQLTATATGLTTLDARDGRPDWPAVDALVREWAPEAFVVGVPRHRDGSAHAMTRAAERFARQLEGRYRLPVHLEDERLTSREAERLLAGRPGSPRKVQAKAEIDKLAARIILQSWLDSHGDNP
ncbi:MAG TPA: Holliday junction resolvase RuvX [Gammaproteobacteria bacterium]|nr:Holliday junction resolvase RuvX [Gammaproteobacteria bacterium]